MKIETKATNIKSVGELKDVLNGKDVYIVGSGKSIDFYQRDFFKGKTVVAINKMWQFVYATYVVATHHEWVRKAVEARQNVIASEYDPSPHVYTSNKVGGGNYWMFPIDQFINYRVNVDRIHDESRIVTGVSTIIPAIHIAAYLGAVNIFIVGGDGYSIDGEFNCDGYYEKDSRNWVNISYEEMKTKYEWFVHNTQRQMIILRDEIEKKYGANIVRLNPFMDNKGEGHTISFEISKAWFERLRVKR